MLALADELEREGDRLKAEAAGWRAVAAARKSLTIDTDSTNLHGVNAAANSAKLARGMSRSRAKKHLFVRALYDKQRITVTEWAKRHGYKPGTVAAWVAKPGSDGARRIPREAADIIETELGVPATLATWRNGITEPE